MLNTRGQWRHTTEGRAAILGWAGSHTSESRVYSLLPWTQCARLGPLADLTFARSLLPESLSVSKLMQAQIERAKVVICLISLLLITDKLLIYTETWEGWRSLRRKKGRFYFPRTLTAKYHSSALWWEGIPTASRTPGVWFQLQSCSLAAGDWEAACPPSCSANGRDLSWAWVLPYPADVQNLIQFPRDCSFLLSAVKHNSLKQTVIQANHSFHRKY